MKRSDWGIEKYIDSVANKKKRTAGFAESYKRLGAKLG
jgi:hypothetical protein